jgi:hypothetical protein
LPKAAADKLRRLREDQQQINAFLQGLSSQQSDENRRRLELAADVEQLKNSRTRSSRGGSTISPTYLSRGIPDGPVEHYAPPQVATGDQIAFVQHELEDAEDRCRQLAERIAAAQQRRSRLVDNIAAWLAVLPPDAIIKTHPPGTATKREAALADLEPLRAKLVELRGEVQTIRFAPMPASNAKAAMRKQVESLAAAGQPDVLPLLDGYPLRFPQEHIQMQTSTAQGIGITTHSQPNLLALFTWLHRDELIGDLEDLIDEVAGDDEQALSPDQKRAKEAEVLAAILQFERQEEALIEALEASGATIARREEADPRAVLNIEVRS